MCANPWDAGHPRPITEPDPIVVGRRPGVVEETVMIARMWRGWVRTERANAYVAYITGTGLREYAATPGNPGCQMWTRDLGDGRTEHQRGQHRLADASFAGE